MKLKGVMTLKLTDINTHEEETYVDENMVTDAVNDILGSNPMGIFYKAEANNTSDMTNWKDTLLPIVKNMIGGIILFPSVLTESESTAYAPSANHPTGYANSEVNTTLDTARGSMNLGESVEIPGGFRFVWEFTPSQGNGLIAAAALTSKQGGIAAHGSSVDAASPYLLLKYIRLNQNLSSELLTEIRSHIIELDFEHGLVYCLHYASGTIKITKYQVPTFDIGLMDSLNGTSYRLLDTQVITPSGFAPTTSNGTTELYIDGGDGYWYGFTNGAGNSSGNASVKWIKIKKEDYTFTEGTWTLSNVQLKRLGYNNYSGTSYSECSAVIRGGYLYAMSYDRTSVYKINLTNSADVTCITLGITANNEGVAKNGGYYNNTHMILVVDRVVGRGWQLDTSDNVILTKDEGCITYAPVSSQFRYKEFLISYGVDSSHFYLQCHLYTPFLATVNNLAGGTVNKTAEKMMKITYELTEQTT